MLLWQLYNFLFCSVNFEQYAAVYSFLSDDSLKALLAIICPSNLMNLRLDSESESMAIRAVWMIHGTDQ
jgi:hypothetical protein